MTRRCYLLALLALLAAGCDATETGPVESGTAGGSAVAADVSGAATGSDSGALDRQPAADVAADPGVDAAVPDRNPGPADAPADVPATRPIAPSVVAPAPWIIAIGDVHGDIEALRNALKLANLIDDADQWIAGETVLVQVGDQLDRGDGERDILHLLEGLADQAWAAGGAIYTLLGNHEVMNVELDLRYVTEGGWDDFGDVPWDASDPLYAGYEPHQRGRVAAFRQSGPYAQLLARHNAAIRIGDTVFVHGGIVPSLAALGLEAINEATRAWMLGEGPVPSFFHTDDDPFWSRHYSDSPTLDDCVMLGEALELLDAERMVVAHTVQDYGISAACQGRVWRIDVGLAAFYGGPTQVLAIQGDEVGVID